MDTKKKKKKKDKPATKEPVSETATPGEENKVLGEVSENTSEGKICAFCKKTWPTKRCSIRHQNVCQKKNCNKKWESLSHEDKKAALVKKEASKVAAAKKNGMKNKVKM